MTARKLVAQKDAMTAERTAASMDERTAAVLVRCLVALLVDETAEMTAAWWVEKRAAP